MFPAVFISLLHSMKLQMKPGVFLVEDFMHLSIHWEGELNWIFILVIGTLSSVHYEILQNL